VKLKLTEKIIVPTETQEGLNANLAEHFGRTPYFTVIELENNEVINVKTITNTSEHAGGAGFAHDHIVEQQPNALIVYGMGPRGINAFQNAGIRVLKANADTVKAVITAYKEGKLQELSEGCQEPSMKHL